MSNASVVPKAREGELRSALPLVETLLQRNRAGEIGETMIDELVNLSWIEWNGGALRLTATGRNICLQQKVARPQDDVP